MISEKQRKFVKEFVKDGNAYQAALRAGYTPGYAKSKSHKWVEKRGIKELIQKYRSSADTAAIMTCEQVQERLCEIIQDCRPSEAISAAGLLSKIRGWYAPTKIAQTDSQGNDNPYLGCSEADLRAVIEKLKQGNKNEQ